jgi:hypothetical protein
MRPYPIATAIRAIVGPAVAGTVVVAIVVVAVVAAAMASLPARAQAQNSVLYRMAQNYPWCLMSSAYEGGENCGFTTFDQCMASRLGVGGFCQINTQYRSGEVPASARMSKLHRRS